MNATVRALMLGLVLMVQAAFPLGAAAETTPGEVVMSGYGGHLVARPATRFVQVTFDRGDTTTFDNARIVVKRDRISVSARSADRTLFAWANRNGGNGGIGMVIRARDRRRHAQTESATVKSITFDGADAVYYR